MTADSVASGGVAVSGVAAGQVVVDALADEEVSAGEADAAVGWDGWRPRLVRGREPLWRSHGCVQLGLDPWQAVAIDGLSPALAELVRGLDGGRTGRRLVAEAVAAGADAGEAVGLLADLAAAGLIEDARVAGSVPDELAADVQAWRSRTGTTGLDLVDQRSNATVEVHGEGRVAISVAMLLAAAGVGRVLVRARGRVTRADVGIGYLGDDVGQARGPVATAAIDRHRVPGSALEPDRRPLDATGPVGRRRGTVADVAVLADSAVHDVALATRLVCERIPHLATQVVDGRAVVGPFVLPGRTGCLRCTDLHRSERDPCWPRIAAQLAVRPSTASHAGTAVAAGMAAEQVLGLLAGSGEAVAIGASVDVDPLTGRLARRPWRPHPACGCGAAPPRRGGPGTAA